MRIGRILTGGLGAFGGRRYMPTLGYGSFSGVPDAVVRVGCVCVTDLYRPGFDAVGVYVPGVRAVDLYRPGFDALQGRCC
jgi:hypothetical protein